MFFSFFERNYILLHVYSFLAVAFLGFGVRCDLNKALARRTATFGTKHKCELIIMPTFMR